MEHRLTAGVRNVDALRSAAWKRGKLENRRQPLAEGGTELLNLPLGVKVPVLPGSQPVFCRTKLGEKLHEPSRYFDLGDPYCRLMSTEYNSLHDPYLQPYHHRRDNIRRLKRGGYVTSNGQVVCTLKEFNEYRQYRTTVKLETEKRLRREEERLQHNLSKSKDAPKLPGEINTSRLPECILQPRKPPCPPAAKSRSLSLESGQCRRVTKALDRDQISSQPELGQEGAKLPRNIRRGADSERKPDVTAGSAFKAAFEQETAAETQELKEVARTVVEEVLERLKAPRDQGAYVLRRAALGIRGRLCNSVRKAEPSETSPPDGRQEMGLVARELVATVLECLGKRLASNTSEASEPGPAAWGKEQPVARAATQASKREEGKAAQAERAASDRGASRASLDQRVREVVDSVCCALESFVSSRFEQDSNCEYSEILELPRGNLSNRQRQPSQMLFSRRGMEEGQGFTRASDQQSLEARKGAKVPVLPRLPDTTAAGVSPLSRTIARESVHNTLFRVQQRHTEQTGYAGTAAPEALGTVREMQPKPRALADSLAIRTMASQIADSVLQRICQPGPAPTPKLNFARRLAKAPAPQDGKESCPTEEALPPVGPWFSRQHIPPAGPKPPAQTGA